MLLLLLVSISTGRFAIKSPFKSLEYLAMFNICHPVKETHKRVQVMGAHIQIHADVNVCLCAGVSEVEKKKQKH